METNENVIPKETPVVETPAVETQPVLPVVEETTLCRARRTFTSGRRRSANNSH